MKQGLKLSVVLVAMLLALQGKVFADVTVGQAAPDFSLTDTKGQAQSLSAQKGKFVVLEWYNHDCPFVKKHYGSGNMQKLQDELAAKGVVWFSINSSAEGKEGYYAAEEANKLLEESKAHPAALLMDTDGKVGLQYAAKTTPHMYIINPEGVLIYQGAIDSTASADSADIEKSTNYVRQALDEALAGQPVSMASTKSYGCSVKYKN